MADVRGGGATAVILGNFQTLTKTFIYQNNPELDPKAEPLNP